MIELTTDAENLTDDLVPRLIITEKLEGDHIIVSIARSELLLVKNAPTQLKIKVGHDEGVDPELIKEIPNVLQHSAAATFMKGEGITAVLLKICIIQPGKNYVVPAPIIIIREAMLETEHEGRKGSILVPLFKLNDMAPIFGAEPPPMLSMPLGVAAALIDKKERDIQRFRKRIRGFPSKFGTAKFTPEYYLVLADPQTDDERALGWRI